MTKQNALFKPPAGRIPIRQRIRRVLHAALHAPSLQLQPTEIAWLTFVTSECAI